MAKLFMETKTVETEVINHLHKAICLWYGCSLEYQAFVHYSNALEIAKLWNRLHPRNSCDFAYCFDVAKSRCKDLPFNVDIVQVFKEMTEFKRTLKD